MNQPKGFRAATRTTRRPVRAVLAVWLPILLICCELVLGAVLICPRCGYEYQAGQPTCEHCGATLPTAREPAADTAAAAAREPAPEPKAPADTKLDAGADTLVNRELTTAFQLYEKKRYWLCYMFARNGLALNALSENPRARRYRRTLRLVAQCKKAIQRTQEQCPVCKGTGDKEIRTGSISGKSGTHYLHKGCPACRGAGTLPAARTLDRIKDARARAYDDYVLRQQEKGFEEYQGIWAPPERIAGLSARQEVAMKKAFGAPCSSCEGMGFSGCGLCEGTGIRKCPNTSCVAGKALCPDCQGTGKRKEKTGRRTHVGFCDTCNGSGLIRCDTCEGKGYIPCPTCGGKGNVLCKRCNGTGESPVCNKCDGTGVQTCSRCKGSGQYHGAPCPQCNGEGVLICSSCDGFGRKKRR